MKNLFESTIFSLCTILEWIGIGWYDYYKEFDKNLSIYFTCRRNKYTNRRYIRTMRPLMCSSNSIFDDNEWVEI